MRLIDTHSHIYEPEFDEDRSEVMARALASGVERMVLPNIDSKSLEPMLKCVGQWPDVCSYMLGIHPTSVKEDWRTELDFFNEQLSLNTNYVGIGEIGLDLYWDKSFLKEQKLVFEHQLDVAISKNLPVSIHCREAYAETIDSLRKFDSKKLRGVFHSFTMAPENGKTILSLGDFYLGIGGVVTYKNAKFGERLIELPLDRIVLETDAPYLSPVPMRGKRNESSYLVHIASKLADIYNVNAEFIAEKTTLNAQKLFFLSD